MPFVIVGVVVLHIWALHMVGQNNPTGVDPKDDKDTVAFTPYATVKDAFFIGVFCIVLAYFIFYIPNYLGHSDNYIPANPSQTPTHIVPEWYYLPFYAILRAIPSKLLGVTALGASIVVLAFMPWLDTSRVRSANYRPLFRQFLLIFFAVVIGLGYLGSQEPVGGYVLAARLLTAYYFGFFFIILPLLGLFEKRSRCRIRSPNRCWAKALRLALEVGHEQAEQHLQRRHCWRGRSLSATAGAGLGSGGRRTAAAALVVCRAVRSRTIRNSCSAASRSIARSARPVTASSSWRSAISPIRAVPVSPKRRRRRSRRAFRSPTGRTTRARCSSGRAGSPIISRRHSPTLRPRAPRLAARCRRTCPTSPRRAPTKGASRNSSSTRSPLSGRWPGLHSRHHQRLHRPPAGFALPPGGQYNKYFPGGAIGMPQPLKDGQVEYTDGTPTTVDQYGRDVAAFLMWAAEPKLDERHRLGFQVMIFLIVLTGLLYFTKKRVWHDVHHDASVSS